MSALTHCKLSEMASRLPKPLDHLLVSASYEERAYGVAEHVGETTRGQSFICFNGNHISYLRESVDRLKGMMPGALPLELDSDRPVRTFNAFRKAVEVLGDGGPCHVGVDITCFTREATSILLFILRHGLSKGSCITAFYQKAKSYGRSRRGGWLTEGLVEVRTILGYAGSIGLAAHTHLVLLPGFEYERAQEIVDALQPDRISLGHASAEESISATLNLDHDAFMERLEALYLGPSFDRFEFSCVDPFKTQRGVLEVIRKSTSQNVVVACLNTKPATVGVCLAAFERPATQLVYAQPAGYNTAAYSEPSREVLFFSLPVT